MGCRTNKFVMREVNRSTIVEGFAKSPNTAASEHSQVDYNLDITISFPNPDMLLDGTKCGVGEIAVSTTGLITFGACTPESHPSHTFYITAIHHHIPCRIP